MISPQFVALQLLSGGANWGLYEPPQLICLLGDLVMSCDHYPHELGYGAPITVYICIYIYMYKLYIYTYNVCIGYIYICNIHVYIYIYLTIAGTVPIIDPRTFLVNLQDHPPDMFAFWFVELKPWVRTDFGESGFQNNCGPNLNCQSNLIPRDA